MPYGVDKDLGGDNEQNVSWMEKCVSSISGKNNKTGKPYTKSEKIAICKAQLKKSKASNKIEIEFSSIDNTIIDMADSFMSDCIQKLMKSGKAKNSDEAKLMCEHILETQDNEIESAMNLIDRL